ncbi:putative gustatory receptor 28b [Vespula squamosa]|uniref:Gustatory receptor n=1 Tax=Vespula squamosa TaxID=30214 RepID=A0ABD2AXX6_VESSQ
MVEFLLVIEFLTVVRCIKMEIQRANELLSDINVLPISSIALELVEQRESVDSFSTGRRHFVDSKKLFIAAPSSRQRQSRLQIASHKINRIRKLLRTIRQIHLELYRISKSISNIYGVQISLEIAICVFLNTYVLYYFYVFCEKKEYNNNHMIYQFVVTILHCSQYSMKIFAINYICDKTTKEAEHTSEIIHTFYGNNTDIEIKKEVEIFSLQMMQGTILYSAFGLYNLNCKHICSCIGIITTYMVIMIQRITGTFKMFRSKEFQRSVMPLIVVNSIVCTGLLEYFVDRTIRLIGFVYVVCCFVLYSICFFMVLSKLDFYTNSLETELLKIISTYQFFNNYCIYMILIFIGFRRRKRMKLFIGQMEICTQRMDELNVSENYSSFFRYQCITYVFLSSLIFYLYLVEALWFFDKNLSSNGDYILILMIYYTNYNPIIAILITDFTFVFWIRQVNCYMYCTRSQYLLNNTIKFVQLNAVLRSMLTTTIDSPQHKKVLRMKNNWEDDSSLSTIYGTYKANENLVKLKRVKQIHLELMKCASNLNEAYELQILISIFTSILFLTTVLYNMYVILISNNYYNWITQIFAKTNICQTTITEILYELYEPSTSRKFRDQVGNNFYQYLIRDFMYQLIQNRLKFTVCGFYDLDHTVIYSAIGTITTYLVILLQVGDKPKGSLNNMIYNSTTTIKF